MVATTMCMMCSNMAMTFSNVLMMTCENFFLTFERLISLCMTGSTGGTMGGFYSGFIGF